MQITCPRCSAPNQFPDHLQPGTPIYCSRCGYAGAYEAPGAGAAPQARRPARNTSSGLLTVVLIVGGLFGACLVLGAAVAIPLLAYVMAFGAVVASVLLFTGKVGGSWKYRKVLGVGGIVTALLLGLLGVAGAGAKQEQAEKRARERAAEKREREQAEHEREREQEREQEQEKQAVEDAESKIRDAVEDVRGDREKLTASIADLERAVKRERWARAAEIVRELEPTFSPLLDWREGLPTHLWDRVDAEVPKGVKQLRERYEEQREAVEDKEDAVFEATYEALWGEGTADKDEDRQVARVARRLDVSKEYVDDVWIRRQDEVTTRLKAEEEARQEAREERCGPKPLQSSWDGAVVAAENHVETTAHDPDSIEFDGCTKPRLTDDCWVTTCTFRGKNAFGALVRNRMRFYIGHNPQLEKIGRVLRAERL